MCSTFLFMSLCRIEIMNIEKFMYNLRYRLFIFINLHQINRSDNFHIYPLTKSWENIIIKFLYNNYNRKTCKPSWGTVLARARKKKRVEESILSKWHCENRRLFGTLSFLFFSFLFFFFFCQERQNGAK